ncbi:MAG: DUF1365 domain-containing protein, partial [Chthonomonadales bacterium]
LKSAIYEGRVSHFRRAPVINKFSYKLYMMYLDLSELDSVFKNRTLWSSSRFNLRWFRREDHVGDPKVSLESSIRELVHDQTGHRPKGPVRLLTQLRHFGQVMNPVCFYYCWDEGDKYVETVVAEVRNTPWRELHCYVVNNIDNSCIPSKEYIFPKNFHVSPFMSMNQQYRWKFSDPRECLKVNMENWEDGEKIFEAYLDLARQPITAVNLARSIVLYPFCTTKVITGIYWQALKLKVKGCPYHSKPNVVVTGEVPQVEP